MRRAKATAKDDGMRVLGVIEGYRNERGQYPFGLDAIDTGGARLASMSYVRDGESYTLVVSASAGRYVASCTRRAGDTDWDCRSVRNK